MFASNTPRDLNHDPQPFMGADGSRKSRYSRFAPRHNPRPEFDHVQHNEPNPILIALRRDIEHVEFDRHPERLMAWWFDETRYDEHGKAEMIHARKVLTRLANLTAVSS